MLALSGRTSTYKLAQPAADPVHSPPENAMRFAIRCAPTLPRFGDLPSSCPRFQCAARGERGPSLGSRLYPARVRAGLASFVTRSQRQRKRRKAIGRNSGVTGLRPRARNAVRMPCGTRSGSQCDCASPSTEQRTGPAQERRGPVRLLRLSAWVCRAPRRPPAPSSHVRPSRSARGRACRSAC
jgi:hypothetical protein